MAPVAFEAVGKRFGEVDAVRELSLEVSDGEFVVLVGPSGSGKTTALRMLAGLESVTSGRIRIGERVVNGIAPRERDVAMVFQDYALYPQMTVYDNLAFALRRRKTPKAEIEQRVQRAAAALELGELLKRRPRQLSGGQQQRVALGRALVREPQVFLMDEPLSNLDALLRVNTRTEIKRLQRELGKTTIFVTHDQEEAMVLSDRIAIMQAGKLQQFDHPKTIYNDPINMFVATFIGSPRMNMLPGGVTAIDGETHFQAAERGFAPWSMAALGARPRSAEVTLGVRPEHVRLTRGDGGPVTGTVELVEPVGSVTYVDVRVGATLLKASTDPADDFQDGEPVLVDFVAPRVLFFDTATGDRVKAV
jgi:ABC-type sugar transport system ATPase subunit